MDETANRRNAKNWKTALKIWANRKTAQKIASNRKTANLWNPRLVFLGVHGMSNSEKYNSDSLIASVQLRNNKHS